MIYKELVPAGRLFLRRLFDKISREAGILLRNWTSWTCAFMFIFKRLHEKDLKIYTKPDLLTKSCKKF